MGKSDKINQEYQEMSWKSFKALGISGLAGLIAGALYQANSFISPNNLSDPLPAYMVGMAVGVGATLGALNARNFFRPKKDQDKSSDTLILSPLGVIVGIGISAMGTMVGADLSNGVKMLYDLF